MAENSMNFIGNQVPACENAPYDQYIHSVQPPGSYIHTR